MRKALSLLVTLLITAGAFAQMAPSAEPAGLVTAFCKALENEDAAAVATLTTDDFTITSFDGQTADRDLLGQAVSGGYLVTETMTPINVRSRTYNGTTAIVMGDSVFKGALQGTNFNASVVFTATCVKMPNGWKIASMQLSGTAK